MIELIVDYNTDYESLSIIEPFHNFKNNYNKIRKEKLAKSFKYIFDK